MNRSDKESKKFQEKIKHMFKLNKSNPSNVITTKEFVITDDILADLGKDSPIAVRLKTMKELGDYGVATTKLEKNGVEKLWTCIEDLFNKDNSLEVRHASFQFLQNVIKYQFDNINMMRLQFFRFIKTNDNNEDWPQKIDLLAQLTNNGKDVEHFEEEIGPFLLNCVENHWKIIGKITEFLIIIDNIIKFNSPHLDEVIMTGFIRHFCDLCTANQNFQLVMLSLQILGTIVAYSILPTICLTQFVGTLCRTVNLQCYAPTSWKIIKNLLGTHMGHVTLFTMCRFLQDSVIVLGNDVGLMRGCVFFIHKALWDDDNCLGNLCAPPSSILPSFLHVVKCNNSDLNYEISIALQKLVKRNGPELLDSNWTIIFDIILLINNDIELNNKNLVTMPPPYTLTIETLNDILLTIEDLIDNNNYFGSLFEYFELSKQCCIKLRPEQSVLKLLDFLFENNLKPTSSHFWLQNLYNLITDYFRNESRTATRLKVLDILQETIELNGQYEDELIARIVIPHMQQAINDNNIIIRTKVTKLLINFSMNLSNNLNNNKVCGDLLDILEKLLMKPFNDDNSEEDFQDLIQELIPGLIRIFSKKIHFLPTIHPLKIYQMFNQFLDKQILFSNVTKAKLLIYEFFLNLRADALCRLGYPIFDTNQLRFSPFICVCYKNSDTGVNTPPLPQSPTAQQASLYSSKMAFIPLECCFNKITMALVKEKDWEVVGLILRGLPIILQNKSLILTKNGKMELNILIANLCQMLNDKTLNLPETLNISRLELQTAVVPVLAALACYNQCIDLPYQQLLINTLTISTGIDPRSSRQCIDALTICTIDMRDVMMKLLPDVLLRLSKISATKHISMPILEFLSTLSQFPTVYRNFVSDQYMTIFAIALPYTNPFKFDNYVVSLAYHVISVWFLKCRLSFRKHFIKFIIKGLHTNVIIPFKEVSHYSQTNPISLSELNQDSSDRKRSSSLTEQVSGAHRRHKTMQQKSTLLAKNRDRTIMNFYEELNETCLDFMARYTFGPSSALPKRSAMAEFLLNGGGGGCMKKSWMLGNKLITITTSGRCGLEKQFRGLCEKCWTLCQRNKELDGNVICGDDKENMLCSCWCQDWAEILIRRPTGNVSWFMKAGNQFTYKEERDEFPLNELAALYMPSIYKQQKCNVDNVEEIDIDFTSKLSRQSSQNDSDFDIFYDDNDSDNLLVKSRNPVRRSNSSPEMANWKNPFLVSNTTSSSLAHQQEQEQDDGASERKGKFLQIGKDVRVSCEAIPEEILGLGNSPPSASTPKPETSLLSCHSYPGSSPPTASSVEAKKPYKTVPVSPTKTDVLDTDLRFERPTNLSPHPLPLLSNKPPQSPTQQISPKFTRHMSIDKDGNPIQKSSSSSLIEKSFKLDTSFAQKRDRVHTVSIMNTASSPKHTQKKDMFETQLDPSAVFLQLYHNATFGSPQMETPVYVHSTRLTDTAINILDKMYPYETHKIGVVYINHGQINKEGEILRNLGGSVRYMKFLECLGDLLKLSDVNPHSIFLGGLEQNGQDGRYFYMFQDDLVMITFHVATLMPNKETDLCGYSKKAHVGNDNVLIVYNDSGDDYDITTIRSQVTLAYIIIHPLDKNINKVIVKAKPELLEIIGSKEPILVSDQSVTVLVRQLALHADLAATVLNSLRCHASDPYVSNWLERLRKLKDVRMKALKEIKTRRENNRHCFDEFSFWEDVARFATR